MRNAVLLVLLFLPFAGCSKDVSGAPRDAFMDRLSGEQLTIVCAWAIQRQGGSGVHSCPSGQRSVMTIEECVAAKWPHCPLALFEDCVGSMSGPCDRGQTGECKAFDTCSKEYPALGADAGVAGGDAGG